MKHLAKSLLALIAILAIQGCSAGDDVAEKEAGWKEKLAKFQPVGKSVEELNQWQIENSVPFNSYPRDEGLILETVEGDGFVCSKWHIYLSIKTDEHAIISEYSISSAGSCL